jgi:hypothetical protein
VGEHQTFPEWEDLLQLGGRQGRGGSLEVSFERLHYPSQLICQDPRALGTIECIGCLCYCGGPLLKLPVFIAQALQGSLAHISSQRNRISGWHRKVERHHRDSHKHHDAQHEDLAEDGCATDEIGGASL